MSKNTAKPSSSPPASAAPEPAKKRSYNSSRRQLQAAQTRADVLAAARELFNRDGWSATTLADVAGEAGVAVETIYKGFGSKKALLLEAMDTAVVGDADPVPFAERPEFHLMGEGTIEDRIAHVCRVVADIHERSAGIWQAVVEAAGSDREMEEARLAAEANRRFDTRRGTALVLGHEPDEDLVTTVWLINSPEAYRKLTVDVGMTKDDYMAFINGALHRLFVTA